MDDDKKTKETLLAEYRAAATAGNLDRTCEILDFIEENGLCLEAEILAIEDSLVTDEDRLLSLKVPVAQYYRLVEVAARLLRLAKTPN